MFMVKEELEQKNQLFFSSDLEVAEHESHFPVLVSSMVLHG